MGKQKELSEMIILSENLGKKRDEMRKKLPYQINLIDELHANENAHSRIFLKLIEYKENEGYPFLQSFLKFLKQDFENIKIKEPEFFNEKGRIDALIEDKEYAVIIENKIHGASDQKGQINRYIEKCEQGGFTNKQIYVLYLTKDGGSPSEDSLLKKKKEEIGDRYSEISYQYDILPWLRNFVLPYCRIKDILLISAIQQYIDHLEGMFNERKIEKKMNDELEVFLKKKLAIEGDEFEQLESLSSNTEKIKSLKDFIEKVRKDIIYNLFKKWYDEIKTKYSEGVIITNVIGEENMPRNYWYLGIKLEYEGTEFVCAIGWDNINSNPYYGLTSRISSNDKVKDDKVKDAKYKIIKQLIDGIKDLKSKTNRWYAWKDEKLDDKFIDNYLGFCEEIKDKGGNYL